MSKPSVIAAESNTGTRFEIDLGESKALFFFFFCCFLGDVEPPLAL